MLDVVGVCMCLFLIHTIFKTNRRTYQEEADTYNITTASITCFVLSVLVHPDLNA